MKAKFSYLILIVFAFVITLSESVKADSTTVYFPTLGNCYLCKLRIEAAVNELEGIQLIEWDYDTKITTASYEDNITDPFIIMDAIAAVGHDTEWYPAPDSAYHTLIGTCCEYERTNDYTNVQVGYLSLMDLWVFHVGINDVIAMPEISVYPTAGTGNFTIKCTDPIGSAKLDLAVFSMNGTLVHHTERAIQGTLTLELGHLQNGQYVVVVTSNGSVLARNKIIKL